jgi:hypothetical protein
MDQCLTDADFSEVVGYTDGSTAYTLQESVDP